MMPVRRYLERWQSWREVVRRQEESGLSVAAFCREQQVPPASSFASRTKLAESDRLDAKAGPERDAKAAPAVGARIIRPP